MKTYKQFIKENNNDIIEDEIEIIELFNLMVNFFGKNDIKSYTEIASLSYFMDYSGKKLDQSEIDDEYNRFKKYLDENNYNMSKIKELYSYHRDKFINSYGYTYDFISDINVHPYGAFSDMIFYEASNGKFEVSGLELTDINNDSRLTRYSYGWHTSKYGKIAINQQFGSIEKFKLFTSKNAYNDINVDIDDYEKINDYYFVLSKHNNYNYIDNYKEIDLFYIYEIDNNYHIISYIENILENEKSFIKLIGELEKNNIDFKSFFMNHKFPKSIEKLLNTNLKTINNSVKTINKFKL